MGANGMNVLLLVFFMVMIYFLMIRPQKKKEKADKEMREALSVGDEIMTIGGVIGKIVKITDKSVVITTGAEKTKIEFIKSAIASVSSQNAAKSGAKKTGKAKAEEAEDKAPNREKKVAPKKLGSKKEEEPAAEEVKEENKPEAE